MKNSNERMIELYQEAIDGHKHEWEEELEWETKWHDKVSFQFMGRLNYRIKKDKTEEAADEYLIETIKRIPILAERREIQIAFKAGYIAGGIAALTRNNNND